MIIRNLTDYMSTGFEIIVCSLACLFVTGLLVFAIVMSIKTFGSVAVVVLASIVGGYISAVLVSAYISGDIQ